MFSRQNKDKKIFILANKLKLFMPFLVPKKRAYILQKIILRILSKLVILTDTYAFMLGDECFLRLPTQFIDSKTQTDSTQIKTCK